MYRNYFKSAFRNLNKNRVFSFINITGLAIGLGAFLLIFQFVRFEQSFDNFHTDKEQVYRIRYDKLYGDQHDSSAGLAAGAGPMLKKDFPEVEEVTKMWFSGFMSNLLTVEEQVFNERKIFYADNSFFDFFDFELITGNRSEALEKANTLMISESRAMTYYGATDVIGKTIRVDNGMGNELYQISGVFKDLPANTHFDFDVLLSFQTLANATDGDANSSFGWNAFPTYVRLVPGTDTQVLESKFKAWTKTSYARIIANGVEPILLLQPLDDIYLHSDMRFEVGPTGNARIIQILTGVALFILILAYFNYINLSTSRSLERTKEIGVRKVNGASRKSLITQFLTEAFVVNLLGIVLGFTLMQVAVPLFESALDRPLSQIVILDESFIILLFILLVAGTLLSGFYPAWILSGFRTSRALKGHKTGSGSGEIVRKGLVVMQFSILAFLLIGSLTVHSQIRYMINADWGFESEQMVVVPGPSLTSETADKITAFKNDLRNASDIIEVSNTTMIPGSEIKWINNNVRLSSSPEDETMSIPYLGVDDTYMNNLGLELLAGRLFDKSLESDKEAVLISRAAARRLGFQNPEEAINQKIVDSDALFVIVGVVEDFLQQSFKTDYDPIIYRYLPLASNYFCVRVNSHDYQAALVDMKVRYEAFFPEGTFQYFFLDEFFQRQFEEDKVFGNVFNFFTLLGVWISCLGLFGLTSSSVLQRKKEIGIRKILGASVKSIILIISKRFVMLTLIALGIAIPVSWYATGLWLDSYNFAAERQTYVFLIPVLMLVFITMLTTSLLSLKTATSNPVDSLRAE